MDFFKKLLYYECTSQKLHLNNQVCLKFGVVDPLLPIETEHEWRHPLLDMPTT